MPLRTISAGASLNPSWDTRYIYFVETAEKALADKGLLGAEGEFGILLEPPAWSSKATRV